MRDRLEDHRDYTCPLCRKSAMPCEKHLRMTPQDNTAEWRLDHGKGWTRPTAYALPCGTPGWFVCACGVGINQMEERMRLATLDTEEGEPNTKEVYERGRSR